MYSRSRRRIYAKNPIDHLSVFNAYNWVCVLCGEVIDRNVRFPSLDAATLEHLIPLSRGGSHSLENVRPAHARCNFEKADRLLEEF